MKFTSLLLIEKYAAGALGGLGTGILIQQGLDQFVSAEIPEDIVEVGAGFCIFSCGIWIRGIYERTLGKSNF